ncbi:O-antigen polysaccharide polymerase Wzy [Morganella morganii]|uniref:O-antigen polysaccharide polymerase Wzy n=1 Tax=Morganella morganii TaxID=582 RepID=UPI0034E4DAC2
MARLLLPLQILILIAVYLYTVSYGDYKPLQIILLFNITISIICGFKEKDSSFLFIISVFLFTLFIYSRYILDIFSAGITASNIATRFTPYTISFNTMTESLLSYNFFIIAFLWGFKFRNKKINLPKKRKNASFKNLALILLILSLPGLCYKMYITLSSVLEFGYLAFYNGIDYGDLGHYLEFLSYKLYLLACLLYLCNNLSKKEFIFIAIILLTPTILMLIGGKRNEFAITIIYLIWYWHSYIEKIKLNYKTIIIMTIMIITLSFVFQFVQNNRNNTTGNQNNPILSFIFSQGVSGLVLPYYIDMESKLPNRDYPYIIAPIVDRIHRGTQSYSTIEKTNYLSYQLTYALDRDSFLRGEGIGASYIAEMFQFGYLGVIFGGILIGFCIRALERNKEKQYIKYMSYLFLSTIIFLPRGELFELFYEVILYTAIYIVLIVLKDIIDGKNRLHTSVG